MQSFGEMPSVSNVKTRASGRGQEKQTTIDLDSLVKWEVLSFAV